MIKREDLIKTGRLHKPHGVKGEITLSSGLDILDEHKENFIICDMDGIFVPFLVEEFRYKSDTTAFVKLKGLDSDEQMKIISNRDVYSLAENVSPEEPEEGSWGFFTGFTVFNEKKEEIGSIKYVDTTTLNTLFVIEGQEDEILIPAVEEMITGIDKEAKKIYLILPEGLMDI